MKNLPGNHLSLFILFTIYFCALMTVVNAANTSDIQLLKTQIKDLQTQTKSLQIKTQLLKTQNQDLQSWRNLFSSYCGFSVFGNVDRAFARTIIDYLTNIIATVATSQLKEIVWNTEDEATQSMVFTHLQ